VVAGATIREQALSHDLCPFEVSLALAERAHVVVSDLNYVFEPNVYLRRFFDAPYDRDLLIVDEAHNLPARAVGYYSPELDLERILRASDSALLGGSGALRAAGRALSDLAAACGDVCTRLAEERGVPPPWVEPPDAALCEESGARIDEALAAYGAFLAAGGKPPPSLARRAGTPAGRDPLRAELYAARDFCRFAQGDPELFPAIWSPERVQLLCLDPAPALRERLRGFRAALLMSATLTPFEFHGRRLGADGPETLTLDIASPFPRERRLLLAVDSVDTSYRRRSEDAGEIARIIGETAALRPGNYLAFFSSFAYRDQVAAHLGRGPHRVLLQIPGMPAESTLGLLRNNPGETRILCAVHGGVFAEGVDYPGDMAIGVFVVGPGLPAVSPEQELVRSYYEQRLGAGFEYAYVYPGLERVVQAGGRAIRTPEDRAFTVLLGRRFREPMYHDKLPAYWREELRFCDDPIALVREFWSQS
jgi:DNA excision repair protein ERCC-2